MAEQYPLTGMEIKAEDTPKGLAANGLVRHLVDFGDKRILPIAEDFVHAWWNEEKRPISQRSGVREGSLAIQENSLEQLRRLKEVWEEEVSRKVLEFEGKHGYDRKLEYCVGKLNTLMESVTTKQNHFPTKVDNTKEFTLVTEDKLQSLKERWSGSMELYLYHKF